ncbi:MAG: hypothetical protein LUQ23_03160 [Methanomicrobiales archaeon]|nr:hypothetical protein [Methanomicrobiales archaeon]
MADDPAIRCPGCGSLLTGETSIPGIWECRYCACLFPVVSRQGGGSDNTPGAGTGRVTSPGSS